MCWVIVRAQIWAALFQWRHSHQNVFGLLCRSHESHSVCSQLWRLTAPCRTGGQAQQHYTKKQGYQWHHSWASIMHRSYIAWCKCFSFFGCFGQTDFPNRPTSQTLVLAETEQQMLQDLMSEAMEEIDGQHAPGPQENGEDLVHQEWAPEII